MKKYPRKLIFWFKTQGKNSGSTKPKTHFVENRSNLKAWHKYLWSYAYHQNTILFFRERVLQLENELATTQKYAGIPVQLPYEKPLLNGQLSPPELLKQPPVRNSKSHFWQQCWHFFSPLANFNTHTIAISNPWWIPKLSQRKYGP